jgi:O-antigen chain-terminating methyltransferase
LFQVVEHLSFDVLVDVLVESARVLRPGGVLIAETPNALNVRVASANFWIDPTHQRPLHPELLRFLAARSGFVKFEDVFANEIGPAPDFAEVPDSVRPVLTEMASAFVGPGDYALVAWTPASG